MLQPKKVIPSLASAILALTGCGGGDGALTGSGGGGGDGGMLPEELTHALRAWCMTVVDCYAEIDPDYTVQECVDFWSNYYALYLSNDDDPACIAALISYNNCGAALSCSELEMPDSCEAELIARGQACVFTQP